MKAAAPTPSTLTKQFEKDTELVSRKLSDYLEDASEENLHDVRTALRRLDSSTRTFPKGVRRERSVSDYVALCKKFYKANTSARDYDIIRAKLHDECGLPEADLLIVGLTKKRTERLRTARTVGRSLKGVKPPVIREEDVSGSKLKNRYRSLLSKLTRRLSSEIPVALSDATKVDELHEVRKKLKKLRYLLELSPARGGVSSLVNELSRAQDLIGSIRDTDITVDYLDRFDTARRHVAIKKKLVSRRNEEYQKLVGLYGDRPLALVAQI